VLSSFVGKVQGFSFRGSVGVRDGNHSGGLAPSSAPATVERKNFGLETVKSICNFSLHSYSMTIEFSSNLHTIFDSSKTSNIIPDNLESKLVWNLEINLLATLNMLPVMQDTS
jgi:hypothetical protein